MAAITCLSFQTGGRVTMPRPDVVLEVEHLEKKTFARHEVFDFPTELKKRNLELIVTVDYDTFLRQGKIFVVAYMVMAYTKNAGTVNLYKICVQERFRRQSIAKGLLVGQIAKVRKQGGIRIQLWVDVANAAARPLYEQTGFEEVKRLDDYYAPGRTGVQMILNLA